jgi:hypothetical protein
VDARLPTAVQRREAAPEPEGSSRQQEILHAGVDRGARLEAGTAGGGSVDTGDDQDGRRRQGLTRAPGRWRRARGARLLVHLIDRVLHGRVADHNKVPGLGIGARRAVDRGGQDLIDQLVWDRFLAEGPDRALVPKQHLHVGDGLHRAPFSREVPWSGTRLSGMACHPRHASRAPGSCRWATTSRGARPLAPMVDTRIAWFCRKFAFWGVLVSVSH